MNRILIGAAMACSLFASGTLSAQRDSGETVKVIESALGQLRTQLPSLFPGRVGRLNVIYGDRSLSAVAAPMPAIVARVFEAEGVWLEGADRARLCTELQSRGSACDAAMSPSLIRVGTMNHKDGRVDVSFDLEWHDDGKGWQKRHLRLTFHEGPQGELLQDTRGIAVRY